jgi:hypothetical protein
MQARAGEVKKRLQIVSKFTAKDMRQGELIFGCSVSAAARRALGGDAQSSQARSSRSIGT